MRSFNLFSISTYKLSNGLSVNVSYFSLSIIRTFSISSYCLTSLISCSIFTFWFLPLKWVLTKSDKLFTVCSSSYCLRRLFAFRSKYYKFMSSFASSFILQNLRASPFFVSMSNLKILFVWFSYLTSSAYMTLNALSNIKFVFVPSKIDSSPKD